jgi:hypothetical protein
MIKRRKKARSGLDSSQSRNLHERSIVLVDQRPLREAAGQEAQELLREVDRLHAALNEFDRIIQPNYERWESQNLASLLEEERQLEYKISELQSDIDLAEAEAFFKRADPYKIFKKAEAEREAVKAAQQENDTDRSDASAQAEAESQAQYEREAQFSEEEQAFRIYVRLSTELEPDALSEYQYSRLFEEYRAWRKKADSIKKITQKKSTDIPTQVKEIYRILVRRLHPDASKFGSHSQARTLWHELQRAYGAHDLEQLEVLLAITDLHENGTASRSTIFHIRKVANKMKRTASSLKSRLGEVQKTQAWIFWHAKDREKAGLKIRRSVERRIKEARSYLASLNAEIEVWKRQSEKQRPAKKSLKKQAPSLPLKRKASPKIKKMDAPEQTAFDF